MKLEYRAAFARDLRRARNLELLRRLDRILNELKAASTIEEVRGVRRMVGRSNSFRIRVGSYRLGITVEGDVVTLVRFLPRDEVYRHFR